MSMLKRPWSQPSLSLEDCCPLGPSGCTLHATYISTQVWPGLMTLYMYLLNSWQIHSTEVNQHIKDRDTMIHTTSIKGQLVNRRDTQDPHLGHPNPVSPGCDKSLLNDLPLPEAGGSIHPAAMFLLHLHLPRHCDQSCNNNPKNILIRRVEFILGDFLPKLPASWLNSDNVNTSKSDNTHGPHNIAYKYTCTRE